MSVATFRFIIIYPKTIPTITYRLPSHCRPVQPISDIYSWQSEYDKFSNHTWVFQFVVLNQIHIWSFSKRPQSECWPFLELLSKPCTNLHPVFLMFANENKKKSEMCVLRVGKLIKWVVLFRPWWHLVTVVVILWLLTVQHYMEYLHESAAERQQWEQWLVKGMLLQTPD